MQVTYLQNVKLARYRSQTAALAVALLCLLEITGLSKPIQLRNETISVGDRSKSVMAAAGTNQAQTGLLLVQFSATPTEQQRSAIQKAGLTLLTYVPEDAFIARARNASLEQIRSLPFVTWVGPYLPSHKLHRSLQAQARLSANSPVYASVLLAPEAGQDQAAQVAGAFTTIRQQTSLRSGRVIRGQLGPQQLEALAQSDAVLWIEPEPHMRLYDEVASKLVAGDGGPGRLLAQDFGYDGSGVTVAVADSGLNNGDSETMHPDLFGRTPAFFAYGGLEDASDEHSHGTHVAGIIAGDAETGETDENGALYGLGVAPGAQIVAQRIFDGVGNYFAPPGYDAMTKDALDAGAEIGSNSWGDDTQGRYDISTMEFDELVRDADLIRLGDQPYILEFSAGNAGPAPQTIGSPAVGKNVIATGASENDRIDFLIYGDGPEVMADFSSRGPCEDGRIKPDIVAPGTYIASLQSASATDQYAWAPISPNYQYQGGTSQAGPHASGAAAVFVQFYRETHGGETPSPALVKAALINTAVDLLDEFGTAPVPNNDEGWGRIDLVSFFDSSIVIDYTDQTVPLAEGQVFEKRVILSDSTQPLKITLTYTDVPAFPGAVPALVNDLDLEVIGPNGSLYRGNQFHNGESIADAPAADRLNNVEGFLLWEPPPGLYTIRVRAVKVAADARIDTFDVDQDFALIISTQPASPGTGIVSLNRPAYRTGDAINVQLMDESLAGQASASVTIKSTVEAAGENLRLNAAGTYGLFTGSIAIATGQAIADGKLQVADGSIITATYFDVSAGATRTATARADFAPPGFSSVQVTNLYGQALITWTTTEPATASIRFGTNRAALDRSLTNGFPETDQSFTLAGLATDVTWWFELVCTDVAGNPATNNNSGQLFSFVLPGGPPLLLVDSFADEILTLGAPPLSGYTDALDQIGIPYQVWNAVSNPPPTAAALSAYRAVIWRVPELSGGWSATEQTAISNYIASGGALMVASMEVLSRLEGPAGSNFIRNVLHVDSYTIDPESTGAASISGVALDPITSGLNFEMDFEVYAELWGGFIGPDISDTIVPSPDAIGIFQNDAQQTVGLRWPRNPKAGDGRVVFLSFPLDAVPAGIPGADRTELLRRILDFLAPAASTTASVRFDSPSYNVPSVATVRVADGAQSGMSSLVVAVTTTRSPAPMNLRLSATVTPGLFEGSFRVLPLTNAPVLGSVQATNTDVLTVSYVTQGSGETLSATAEVDTIPPVVSLVEADPDYTTAVIYWDTDELADGLVQYGESPFLGKTAYHSDLSTGHQVTLPFLFPDRVYYYRVVSRDAAGNVVTDDNNGDLYTFRTLLPEIAPWFDNLDSGATNWSTYTDPSSYLPGFTPEWQLGTPHNDLDVAAHSAPNAWGTSLNGASMDYAECFLISPAIYLTNGNTATLRFWQNYDFPDVSGYDFEMGQLYVIPSSGAAVTIGEFYDSSYGWEEAEYDLTAFSGQIVYLAWYYLLFSVENLPRSGWLIDDVSVTVANVAPGTVVFTNNIWQATALLRSPISRKIAGQSGVISNAPPGQYEVRYPEVAYYIAPDPQTNQLTSGQTLTFTGIYSFPDANVNGISDLWEDAFFGNHSSYRTAEIDSDGDGMSDLAEFLAGTNPNNPPRKFKLAAVRSNGWFHLEWPAIPGQDYRVSASSNLVQWSPVTEWIGASNTLLATQVAIPPNPATQSALLGNPAFLRVECRSATNAPTQLPAGLQLNVSVTSSNLCKLNWQSARGHGYLVEGLKPGGTWTALSDWMVASGPRMTFNLPAPSTNSPAFFRVRAAP
jgi:hypothetical protein